MPSPLPCSFIPGLLQTQDYAREVISAGIPRGGESEIRRRVMARMARQTLLRREPHPPHLHAIIDEAILQRPIGGWDLMKDQLRHLSRESRRPNISFQVLPFSAGTHAGLEGLFIMLSFPDEADPDVAYTEGVYGDVYLESPAEIDRCSIAFKQLSEAALSPGESVALVDAAAKD
ncbi:hypothetical protein GCM10010191_70360 [Actinomadura vinacea]|uniref:DUF5753 domain-containing protein n=1 Tax=Actinomadura vinacea TaxID=115336 RepID=A0ABN3K0Z8_9ACTN